MSELEKPLNGILENQNYNSVFEELVDQADDGDATLVGIVAYGLYKNAKREWVIRIREEKGRPPNEEERIAYGKNQTKTVLEGYRSQANEIVAAYANVVLESERPAIYSEAIRGTFLRSFWPSLAASFAFAAILSLVIVVAAISGFKLPLEIKPQETTIQSDDHTSE